MDPFEVRMHFLNLLKGLNASQQSIGKVVRYALKYFQKCGDDLWECIEEECQKGTLNTRINILYMLDSLCESSLVAYGALQSQSQSHPSTSGAAAAMQIQKEPFYIGFVRKDLFKLVDMVVPEGREGLANLMSTTQILQTWRTKRVFEPSLIDEVMQMLERRKEHMHDMSSISHSTMLNRNEITKRIEEDRERHKRLRERRWVQSISAPSAEPFSATAIPRLACSLPPVVQGLGDEAVAAVPEDVEFENAWETTSDWNEDDDEDVKAENELCFPGQYIGFRARDNVLMNGR